MRYEPDDLEREADEADDGFTPVGTAAEPVSMVPPSVARSGYLVYRAKDGFEAAVPASLVDRCVAWGRKAAPNEWYGLLVGKLCEHGGLRHVVVLGVVPDPGADGGPSSVRTTSDSEFRTRMSAGVLFPDGIVLGWAHGHLRHGVRFSSVDRSNQRTWTQPHSLGIVVDPWHPERVSVYRGPGSELLTLVGKDASASERPPLPPRRLDSRRFAAPTISSPRVSGAKRIRRFAPWGAVLVGLALMGHCGWRLSERLDALEAKPGSPLGSEARPDPGPAAARAASIGSSRTEGVCREGESVPESGSFSAGP